MCYIDDQKDKRYLNTPCRQLLVNIAGTYNAQTLLAAGGNFGCWHGHTGKKSGPAYASNNIFQKACRDNIQQGNSMSWGGKVTFGVCIKLPGNNKFQGDPPCQGGQFVNELVSACAYY